MPTILRVPVNHSAPYDATSLPAHFAGSSITPCVCVHVVSPIDSSVIGVTSWSQNLTSVPGYSGVTFKSTSGMSASNVEAQQGASPTNMEADLFLITAGITEADALAGKWSRAETTVLLLNYEALAMGQYIIQKGELGQFVQRGQMVSTEIMGWNQKLSQTYGMVTRTECMHTFGDARCTLNLSALGYIKTGAISAVTSQTVFRVSSLIGTGADYFGNGVLQFTSGDNNNYYFHIDSWNDVTGEFALRTPTPYLPVNGNTISATRGCRKRASDCAAFSNILSFGGDPFVPTIEELSRMPVQ